MISKCESCIGRYEHKTSGNCRYCIWNSERHKYLFRDKNREDMDYYTYVEDCGKHLNIPL